MVKEKEYIAFISYQRKDENLAKKLQHTLEYYKLPVAVVEKEPSLKDGVRPIFVDMTELGDEPFLKPAIEDALGSSRFLIVICSPRSAQSKWVNKEVQFFVKLKRTKRIIPFIIDGNPNSVDKDTECCTPLLKKMLGQRELLGININEMGFDAAAVKVVSRMFHVKFSSLWNRYEKEKEEEQRKFKEQNDRLLIIQSRFLAEKANQLVDEGDSYTARLLALKALPKDLDNPDRPLVPEAEAALRTAVNHNSTIFRGHNTAVKSAMFSPNGDYILSFSEDNTIRVWNTIDGTCINIYPNRGIAAHFLTTNGNSVFVSIMNNALQRWDVTQGKAIGSKKIDFYHEKMFCFSQDGSRLYTFSIREYNLNIWDVEKGEKIKSIQKGEFENTNCIAVSNDGRFLACGVKDVIRLYDLRTEELLITYQRPHEYINHIAFNSTGDIIASSSWKTIVLWNSSEDYIVRNAKAITEKCIKTLSKEIYEGIISLSFSPDGQELISTSKSHLINIWAIDKGTCVTLQGHIYDVNSAQLSPNKSLIVSASTDKTVRLWDYRRSPDFSIVFLGRNVIWDNTAFSPNRDCIAIADGNIVRLIDVKTGECKRLFNGHEKPITKLAYSPLGDTLLTTSSDEEIRLWKIDTNDCRILDQAEDSEFFIAYSSDGKMVATGGKTADRKTVVKLWNIETIWDKMEKIYPFKIFNYDNDGMITAATFSSNNELIIAFGLFGNLFEFKVGNEYEDYYCKKVLDNDVVEAQILITPNNEYVIYTTGIGDLHNPLINIWDRNTKILRSQLSGHTDFVNSINLNSEGTLIVSASKDKTIKIWDIKSGVCLKTLYGHTGEVINAVFLDDKHIVSVSKDNTIITWDFPPLQKLIDDTRKRFRNRTLTLEEKKKYYLE